MSHDDLAPILRRDDGFWIDASAYTPDVPLWGPYDTRADALDDRRPLVAKMKAEQSHATKPTRQTLESQVCKEDR
jgi:hypothetical protein